MSLFTSVLTFFDGGGRNMYHVRQISCNYCIIK